MLTQKMMQEIQDLTKCRFAIGEIAKHFNVKLRRKSAVTADNQVVLPNGCRARGAASVVRRWGT